MTNFPHPRAAAVVVAVGLAAVAPSGAHGQLDRLPAYRTQTMLVRIVATVSDAEGNPGVDLNKEDFAVAEDGIPQDIALFARDADTPLSIALVVDTSGSMAEELDAVRSGVRDYLAGMRDDDEIGVITFSGRVREVVGLDGGRDRLLASLDELRAGGGTALYQGLTAGVGLLKKSRHRKQVILLVTDGNNTSERGSRRSATRALQQSEALAYTLAIGHSGRDTLRGRIVAALNGPQMGLLRSWADDSGGRAELVDNVNGAGRDRVIQTIRMFGEELRQQYTLGYYPPVHRPDKKIHQMRITTRHPNQLVRARKVYSTE